MIDASPCDLHRAQPHGGLVEKQDGGRADQGARDLDAVLLAIRQIAGHATGLLAQAKAGQKVHRPRDLLGLCSTGGRQRQRRSGEPVAQTRMRAEENIFQCAQIGKNPHVLEYASESLSRNPVRGAAGKLDVAQPCCS